MGGRPIFRSDWKDAGSVRPIAGHAVPPYAFKDAIIALHGTERVVERFSLDADPSGHDMLVVHFKNGATFVCDSRYILPPKGVVPSIFEKLHQPVELKNHGNNPGDDGQWSVVDRFFVQKNGDPAPTLHVELMRLNDNNDPVFFKTTYNPNTIRAVGGFVPKPVKLLNKINLGRKG